MKLSVAVQHHPSRADLIPALLARLRGLDVEVVSDPEPDSYRNAWRCYRECLMTTPDDATHRVILQDDTTPCRDFKRALEEAILARPDRVLVLFHGGRPEENMMGLKLAWDRGHAWARLVSRRYVPVVAVVWPARLVCPLVCWVDEMQFPRGLTADDEIVMRALIAFDEWPLACVPSIVEHEDVVPKVHAETIVQRGQDPGRRAWLWALEAPRGHWDSGDC